MKSFWYIICLLFFIHNLVIFINDGRSVNYKLIDDDHPLYDRHPNYMLCAPFWIIKLFDLLPNENLQVNEVPISTFLKGTGHFAKSW